MKLRFTILLLLCFSIPVFSSIHPSAGPSPVRMSIENAAPSPVLATFATMKMRDIEKMAGRKFSLKEKIAIKFYQWKLRKQSLLPKGKEKTNLGQAALILGIVGLVTLVIPYASILSIPCIILALVFGYQAKKANPQDRKAKTAIILGWIGVGLIVLAVVLLIAILASWSGGWG
ncbi:MAG: DUF4190 domain-containing protein [Chitinophagaceae bacterium]